jgi:hypothetical protein
VTSTGEGVEHEGERPGVDALQAAEEQRGLRGVPERAQRESAGDLGSGQTAGPRARTRSVARLRPAARARPVAQLRPVARAGPVARVRPVAQAGDAPCPQPSDADEQPEAGGRDDEPHRRQPTRAGPVLVGERAADRQRSEAHGGREAQQETHAVMVFPPTAKVQ